MTTAELAGKHLVLGLTGGIACYKIAELTRLLTKAGATVQIVMTDAATQFITPVTMQALSGRPVYTSQWDARVPNNMAHIDLSREADAIVIAPASTDFLAKLAQGRCDDLLSTLCVARDCPLLVVPAMNRQMWQNPATQRNVAQLRARRRRSARAGFRPAGVRRSRRRSHARAVRHVRSDLRVLPAEDPRADGAC